MLPQPQTLLHRTQAAVTLFSDIAPSVAQVCTRAEIKLCLLGQKGHSTIHICHQHLQVLVRANKMVGTKLRPFYVLSQCMFATSSSEILILLLFYG